jgi:hypothetical protein
MRPTCFCHRARVGRMAASYKANRPHGGLLQKKRKFVG